MAGRAGTMSGWFTNRSVAAKIFISVMVVAVVAIGIGVLSLLRLADAQQASNRISTEAMAPSLKLSEIKLLMLDKRNTALRHASAPDLKSKQQYETAFKASSAALLTAIADFHAMAPSADRSKVNRLVDLSHAYDDLLVNQYMPASVAGDAIRLQQIRGRTSPIVDEGEKILDDLIAGQNAHAAAIERQLKASYTTSRTVVVSVLVVGLLLGLALAGYVARLITRPLARVR